MNKTLHQLRLDVFISDEMVALPPVSRWILTANLSRKSRAERKFPIESKPSEEERGAQVADVEVKVSATNDSDIEDSIEYLNPQKSSSGCQGHPARPTTGKLLKMQQNLLRNVFCDTIVC